MSLWLLSYLPNWSNYSLAPIASYPIMLMGVDLAGFVREILVVVLKSSRPSFRKTV